MDRKPLECLDKIDFYFYFILLCLSTECSYVRDAGFEPGITDFKV